MKRFLRAVWFGLRWAALLILVGVVGLDLFCEVVGVPEWGAGPLRGVFAEYGVQVEAATIRFGAINGLVLDRGRARMVCAGMPLRIECAGARASVRWRSMLRGRVQGDSLALDGLSMRLFPSGRALGQDGSVLHLERGEARAHLFGDGTLALTLDGLLENVAIHIDADIQGWEGARIAGEPQSLPSSRPAGEPQDRTRAEAEKAWRRSLTRISELVDTARLSENDAFLSGRLALNLEDPAALVFAGEFGLSDTVVSGTFVSKAKGTVRYQRQTLFLERVTLSLSRDENVNCQARVDLGAGRVTGQVEGDLRPETACRLAKAEIPLWMDRVVLLSPVSVKAQIGPCALAPAEWQVRGSLSAANVLVQDLVLHRARAEGEWDGRVLRIPSARLMLSPRGDEEIRGSGEVDFVAGTASAQLEAVLRPVDRLVKMGLVPPGVLPSGFEMPAPVTLRARLHPSPHGWRQWRAEADLTCPTARVAGRLVGPCAASMRLQDGVLTLPEATLGAPRAPDHALRLSGVLPLGDALGGRDVAMDFKATLLADFGRAEEEGAAASDDWREALSLNARVHLASGSGNLHVATSGTVFPQRTYATWQPLLDVGIGDFPHRLRCGDKPVAFTFEARRDGPRAPLRLTGALDAESLHYQDLHFRTFHTGVDLQHDRVQFDGVQAVTGDGDEFSLDIGVVYHPLRVTIANARLAGRPHLVATFIEARDARELYQSIWRDLAWSPGELPVIDLRSLVYKEGGGGAWRLNMDAGFACRNAHFRGVQAQSLAMTVRLGLPELVTVRDVRLETAHGVAEAEVSIQATAVPRVSFATRQISGGLDVAAILRAIDPSWDEWVRSFDFSPESAVTCRGSFFLGPEPVLDISGTLEAPSFEFARLRLMQPNVDWRVAGSTVTWDVKSATLFEGPVALTGRYDIQTREGLIALHAEKLLLRQLVAYLGGGTEESAQEGYLSGHCRLHLLHGWAGREVQLAGNGRALITEADVWRVPVFHSLGRLLDMTMLNRITSGRASSLGEITRVEADLTFNGDRVVFSNLVTDGTIVSLKGSGEYCWGTDQLYGTVSGETLSRVSILSLIFRPLSWLFSAELTGTPKDYRWKLATAFQRALSGSGAGD
ncbi:MAG: hypothetical protein JXR77_18615 [Lentisphaeria bacterium]|nr:hypothetical protein [Lentisphaeria bacterium]